MKFTNLLFWVQENRLSAKFYKKLGFDVAHNEDDHSVVRLDGLLITLVSMRDEELFSKDSMASEKAEVYMFTCGLMTLIRLMTN